MPSLPAMLAMLTTRPQPRSTMPPRVACITLKMPVTFTVRVRSQPSRGVSSNGTLGPTMPADCTTMSI